MYLFNCLTIPLILTRFKIQDFYFALFISLTAVNIEIKEGENRDLNIEGKRKKCMATIVANAFEMVTTKAQNMNWPTI